MGQLGQTKVIIIFGMVGLKLHILCGSTGSDEGYYNIRDFALTTLLEYFNL